MNGTLLTCALLCKRGRPTRAMAEGSFFSIPIYRVRGLIFMRFFIICSLGPSALSNTKPFRRCISFFFFSGRLVSIRFGREQHLALQQGPMCAQCVIYYWHIFPRLLFPAVPEPRPPSALRIAWMNAAD